MKTIAIYHKDCTDGTTAAAVVLRKYPDALLFPLGHGFEVHELEPIITAAEKGDNVFTVDCAIGVRELISAGHTVTVIDHHAGADEYLDGVSRTDGKLTYIFDNDKSGASLAWSYFFPSEKMPELIKYVEDRDLWRWKYGDDTKDITNRLFMLDNKPEEVLKLFDVPLIDMKRDGNIITQYTNLMVEKDTKKTDPIYVDIGPHVVIFYNITNNKSESGNILSTKHDQAVGLYTIDGHELHISLRSLDKHIPSALDIARLLGGGGHKNASGAKMSLADFCKAIVKISI